jgi:hypothetical protein
MNALKGFDYQHNSKVTVKTSIGNIELTYINRDKHLAEQPLFQAGIVEFLPSDIPACNERTYFQAALIDSFTNRTTHLCFGISAETAIAEVYKEYAIEKMISENM